MLTIKKRFPSQKLYLYGGTAFVAGFAGIMFLLVQTNTHIRDFMAVSPVNVGTSPREKPEQSQTPATTSTEEVILDQDQVFVTPQSSSTTTTSPQETAPTEEPTPPTEPTPTEPAPEPEPNPEEPTNPIEEIIEEIIP